MPANRIGEEMVNRFTFIFALALTAPLPALAQQDAPLNDNQRTGQRLFTQHCGVCHLKIQVNAVSNGPALSRAIFENGKDAQVVQQIANGSPNMPGYKVMFDASQIDAIAEYLKTVNPAPVRPAPANR
jgi:mono/diheme cytochrome c family protein